MPVHNQFVHNQFALAYHNALLSAEQQEGPGTNPRAFLANL
jgi:hypothetical protein